MKSFTKAQIEKMLVKEDTNKKTYKKKDLVLKEDIDNQSNAYVQPSSDSVTSLATDINRAKAENPTDDTFYANLNSYDGKAANNPVTLDIVEKNPTKASQKIQQTMRNPQVKNLMNSTNVNVKVHLQNEHIEKLRENSVKFTKTELSQMLRKK